jgi:hypothetical protein
MKNIRSLLMISLLLSVVITVSGCPSSASSDNNDTNNTTNNVTNNHTRPDCPASEESGYWLVPIGSSALEIPVGGTAKFKAMVIKSSEEETQNYEDGLAAYYPLTFEILTGTGGSLTVEVGTTDDHGMISSEFTSDQAGTYTILLSGEGVCARQYTVKVLSTLATLEELSTNPSVSYTNRRISFGVQAVSLVAGVGELPLSNKAVTFEFTTGSGTGGLLEDTTGLQGSTMTVNTDVGGKALLFFNTGTAGFTANIRATLLDMSVEPVSIIIEIQDSGTGGPCENNIDCPADAPICEEGICLELVTGGICADNDDCMAPYVCVDDACVPPSSGDRCDLLSSANPCPDGKQCIGGYCTDIPEVCGTNDDCPTGFLCENGICTIDLDDNDDCYNVPCPTDDVCINGICVNPDDCSLTDSPTRLGGTWNFDSMLHLREAVGPFLGGFLTATETLRDIILGTFEINGIPSWLMSIVNDLLQDLIDEYVPQWAQELLVALGNVSDIVDDMRVIHTVNLVAMGNDEYYGTQVWDLIEFEYQGNYVSSPPEDVLGFEVIPDDFTSREICGTFYIDRYHVRNVVGGLIRWAIDVMVTGVTCGSDGMGCYYSLEEALYDLIDCDSIAGAIDDLVYSMFDWAPSVYDPIYEVCEGNKDNAINQVIDALDALEVTFNLLSLRGVSPIVDSSHLDPGRWYGTLGGGNFNGDFTAVKQ